MNELQKQAVELAIEGHNLLILGSAGTGKSYVVLEILKELLKGGKNVQVTCSTGIACSVYDHDVQARTTHKFLGLMDGRYGEEDISVNAPQFTKVLEHVKSTDCLIIDEISMISKRTFGLIERICRLKNEEEVFGGLQIVLCGDFFQLPPVANRLYKDEGEFCFEHRSFNEWFPHRVVLRENLRAGTARNLIKATQEVFCGTVSQESSSFLKALRRPLDINYSETSLKLFAKNDLVDDFNRSEITKMPGDLWQSLSEDGGPDLELLQDKTAPKLLWLKVDCPVILIQNLSDKLYNGLRGVVHSASKNDGVKVKFEGFSEIISVHKVTFTVFNPAMNENRAWRKQYPLKLAFGLTIHKAQGMTLDRVEVDCREIFRPGQLGVALSRTRRPEGLRVINYHPRYALKPAKKVTDFMEQISKETLLDRSCCQKKIRRESPEVDDDPGDDVHDTQERPMLTHPTVGEREPIAGQDVDNDCFDDELDDDFNEVISSLMIEEDEITMFQIPADFDFEGMKDSLLEHEEITQVHRDINRIVENLIQIKLVTFVKQIMLKMAVFVSRIKDSDIQKGVPEKKLLEFAKLVQSYSTGPEYRLNSVMLFEQEGSFSGSHMIVCYKILEWVRQYYIKKKVDLLKVASNFLTKRYVSNPSRARIRYVAGYCISTLRKKFTKTQNSNRFKLAKEAQDKYYEARCNLKILNVLKENEQFLHETTTEPESLLDINRKQNISRGLTNVSDTLFKFFLTLTDKSLQELSGENLVKFGKAVYTEVNKKLSCDKELLKTFSQTVVTSLTEEKMEEFDLNVSNLQESPEHLRPHITFIFQEIIESYLHVLMGQFRKDIKTSRKLEKKMAHRKQVKVSKTKTGRKGVKETEKVSSQEVVDERLEETVDGPSPRKKRKRTTKRKTQDVEWSGEDLGKQYAVAGPSTESPVAGPSAEFPVAGPSAEFPVAGPFAESPVAGPSAESSGTGLSKLSRVQAQDSSEDQADGENPIEEGENEICKKCQMDRKDMWIHCDLCNSWFHRKCSGLSKVKQWRKFTRKGTQWFCYDCK